MTTAIASCSTTNCAFNNGGCTALGITVAGDSTASCATFATLDARSSRPAEGTVGACHRLECTHNKDLLCTNSSITITGDKAECDAYQVA
ncbi:DUF1540 domain-containing protein [Corynebacterium cystitidis]|uniref:DUF1540 domain-containing protein n=1 Tax=Corynebacterium cystitidis DSM 20524 TaxID=1121357 RepID=A0A1H9UH29_9CORY|nr:DUF1540 domain-containing protein [Corynebacterium cystitidis]WJY83728.1 hypothetical protein CCYS_14235 [Corynebacterium cystitidis DSM 20524]SES08467.1 protein of unknown function [Corynebacterium cystitidis DSM 20524]SNV91117.1 Domain of Uncharacterised Function (DUF1540) [Corynebacterium cystitidis]